MTTTPVFVRTGESTEIVVNGTTTQVGMHHPHLLAALREEAGVTSAKDGCAPQGQCGCCTVLLDGKAIQACLVTMEKAAGKEVLRWKASRMTSATASLVASRPREPCNAASARRDSGTSQGAD